MGYLLLQTFLLMLAAFFLGALLACLVKSAFFGRTVEAAEFGYAAPPRPGYEGLSQAAVEVRPPAPPVIEVGARPRPAHVLAPDATRFERALTQPGTAAEARAAAVKPGRPEPAAVAAAEAAATAAALAAAEKSRPPAGARPAAPVPAPAVSAKAPAPAQDLTRIRAIDGLLARRLAELGVSRYEQVVGWSAKDVDLISGILGFKGRIQKENWIEQAQILARGGETAYARQRAAEGSPCAEGAGQPRTTPPAPPHRAAAAKAEAPEVRPSTAAAQTARPVAPPVPTAPGAPAKSGTLTLPASGSAGPPQAAASVRSPTPPIASVAPPAGPAPAHVPKGAEGAAQASAVPSVPPRTGQVPSAAAKPAATGSVPSIGAAASGQKGAAAGPAAPSSASPITPPRPPTPEPARPGRLTDALRETELRGAAEGARTDLSGLRSVRSEALRGPDTIGEPLAGSGDDLKRIRGIGVLVEKKLNSIGINSYAQIAGWTNADVERVSRHLDLAGRIERESWIEQARILGTGGHTEFSRLLDRGEGPSGAGS